MKINELNHQKLAQVLLMAPLSALHHKHATLREEILEMKTSGEKSLEVEYVHDLLTLSPEEVVDKWFEGKENIVGFFYDDV